MKRALLTLLCAVFVTVLVAQNRVDIKPQELPKCVSEWVTKNMEGYTIDKAYKYETKTGDQIVILYYVRVTKDKTSQWLQFDSICKEVKKLTASEAEKPPKTKPPLKQ